MTAIFALIPEVLPVAVAGDLVARIFANRSTFPSGAKLLVETPLTATRVGNVNRIGIHAGLTAGDLVDLTGTRVTSTSSFGANMLQVQPPPVYLRGTKVTNTSSIGAAPELAEAPADGYLRATKVTNASSFGADVLSAADTGALDDGDDLIGGGPTDGMPT